MKVLHIVTWLDEVNSFGGPVAVARNLTKELSALGDETQLIAAGPRSAQSGNERVFRSYRISSKLGFSGVLSPSLVWWVGRNVKRFDAVHVHVCRDLVTLPAAKVAQWRGASTVLQPHGMVDLSRRRLARSIDALLTKRVFAHAKAVLALTTGEQEDLTDAGLLRSRVEILPNGIGLPEVDGGLQRTATALFVSRLHPRKRPMSFVRTALALLDRHPETEWQFLVAGPDEGEAIEVQQTIAERGDPRLRYLGPIDPGQVSAELARAACLILPSVNEPFPMVVLEAMAVATPVVITESCGLAPFVREHSAGVVVPDDDQEALSRAAESLLRDPVSAATQGARGRSAVSEELSITSVTRKLRSIYDRCAASRAAAAKPPAIDSTL